MANKFTSCLGHIINIYEVDAITKLYICQDGRKSFGIIVGGQRIDISDSTVRKPQDNMSFDRLSASQQTKINTEITEARNKLVKEVCGTEVTRILKEK